MDELTPPPNPPLRCSACGVANLRDLDPDLVKRARMLAKKRTRSLGFFRTDEKRR